MQPPFDREELDRLMEEAGVDVVLVTAKHNTRYLLGGYRYHFHDEVEAAGRSRYLSAVGYPRGRPEDAFFVGWSGEVSQLEREPIWVPQLNAQAGSSVDVATAAAEAIDSLGLAGGKIAIELPFLPADTYAELARRLPHATLVDGVELLEELRAVKRPEELGLLREVSDRIVASMLAAIAQAESGISTRAIAELLRHEEVSRGLGFDYCLVATDRSYYRAPSDDRWEQGMTISLDSGGTMRGYIGDLARMAVMGEPDDTMRQLLEEIDAVQMAARRPIREGGDGAEIFAAAEAELARLPHRDQTVFEAHGMGLVHHEQPHVGAGMSTPLESGMVLSIETTMLAPRVGFIKLEDTVAVTRTGCEVYGDTARGWNVAGHAAAGSAP